EARSNVVVTQKDQVVTGELAVFDTKANTITMTGGVVMTQCKNVMRGDRLTVDMTTGMSRVESDGTKGVQVLLPQGGNNEGCGSPAKPGGAPPAVPSLLPGKQKSNQSLVNSPRAARLTRARGACIYPAARS